MLSENEPKRTVRIGLSNAGYLPTVDIVGPAEGSDLLRLIADNAVAFGHVVAQFVADHTSQVATLREACVIEVSETQLYAPPE
jgi:hypothetical protein